MEKTILIPTDLTIESLVTISYALEYNPSFSLRIILLHGFRNSDSIINLLFYDDDLEKEKWISKDFKNAYEKLKIRNVSRIKQIGVEFFCGNTKAALSNFIEANHVDEIFLPVDYKFSSSTPNGFDVSQLLKNQVVPTVSLSWCTSKNVPQKDLPAGIFLYRSNHN